MLLPCWSSEEHRLFWVERGGWERERGDGLLQLCSLARCIEPHYSVLSLERSVIHFFSSAAKADRVFTVLKARRLGTTLVTSSNRLVFVLRLHLVGERFDLDLPFQSIEAVSRLNCNKTKNHSQMQLWNHLHIFGEWCTRRDMTAWRRSSRWSAHRKIIQS